MASNEDNQEQDSSHERANAIVDQAKQKAQRKAEQAALRGAKAGGRMAVQAGTQVGRAAAQLAAQAAAAAAEAVASLAAATSEIWVPVGAIIIALVIIIIAVVSFILFFIGTPQPVAGVEPTPTPGVQTCESLGGFCSTDASCSSVVPESVPDTTLTCTDSTRTCCMPKNVACDTNPIAAMKQNFNVVVQGDSDLQHLKTICNILSIPGRSPTYTGLLKRGGPTEISFDNLPCGGRTNIDGSITLHDFWNCGSAQSYVLIHETGHTIAIYNGNVSQGFLASAYYPSDPACYYVNPACTGFTYTHYLRTYGPGCGGGGRAESFAESLALYVMPKGVLSNYQTQCPVGYNWERINIFGGTTF